MENYCDPVAPVAREQRRRAVVTLYPGIELPTDVYVLTAWHDYECDRSVVVLAGDWLPMCREGERPLTFHTIGELLAHCWDVATDVAAVARFIGVLA